MQEINEKMNTLKEHYHTEPVDDLSEMAINRKNSLTNNDYGLSPGIPPPEDIDCSFSSLSSSISIPDISAVEQLIKIKDKNKEIRRAASVAIKNFKSTSKDLMSISQINSGNTSMILHELEMMKKNINLASDGYKNNKSIESINTKPNRDLEGREFEFILSKIQEIQNEINEASKKLLDSEKLIMTTEESNTILETRIQKIEEAMNTEVETEETEKINNENCLCKIF